MPLNLRSLLQLVLLPCTSTEACYWDFSQTYPSSCEHFAPNIFLAFPSVFSLNAFLQHYFGENKFQSSSKSCFSFYCSKASDHHIVVDSNFFRKCQEQWKVFLYIYHCLWPLFLFIHEAYWLSHFFLGLFWTKRSIVTTKKLQIYRNSILECQCAFWSRVRMRSEVLGPFLLNGELCNNNICILEIAARLLNLMFDILARKQIPFY